MCAVSPNTTNQNEGEYMRYKSLYDSQLRDVIWFVIKYRDMYCIFYNSFDVIIPWQALVVILFLYSPCTTCTNVSLFSSSFLSTRIIFLLCNCLLMHFCLSFFFCFIFTFFSVLFFCFVTYVCKSPNHGGNTDIYSSWAGFNYSVMIRV